VKEDHALGSVPWAVYGRFAQRMGLTVVSLIMGAPAVVACCDRLLCML